MAAATHLCIAQVPGEPAEGSCDVHLHMALVSHGRMERETLQPMAVAVDTGVGVLAWIWGAEE